MNSPDLFTVNAFVHEIERVLGGPLPGSYDDAYAFARDCLQAGRSLRQAVRAARKLESPQGALLDVEAPRARQSTLWD